MKEIMTSYVNGPLFQERRSEARNDTADVGPDQLVRLRLKYHLRAAVGRRGAGAQVEGDLGPHHTQTVMIFPKNLECSEYSTL